MTRDAVEVLRIDPSSVSFEGDAVSISDETTRRNLLRAAAEIKTGKLVAFPTETVYGLGASALDERAVKRIFAAKHRPADNPLIIHVSSQRMLRDLLGSEIAISEEYERLMKHFWPGPLSLLFPLPSAASVATSATAGLSTVVVRMPDSAIARALIALAGVPIAAPSANTSGRPSPTAAKHVASDMRAAHSSEPDWQTLLILDGGPCGVGVESTVVDGVTTPGRLRALRLGGLSPEAITEVTGLECDLPNSTHVEAPRTPGQKYRHYAPDARVVLLELADDAPSFQALSEQETDVVGFLQPDPSRINLIPGKVHLATLGTSPEDNARRLFAGLRELEQKGCKIIFVEQPAGDAWRRGVGRTVAERLSKATQGQEVVRVRA